MTRQRLGGVAVLLLLGVAMSRLVSKRKAPDSQPSPAPIGQLDLSVVEGLSHLRAHPDRLRRIVWLLQVWADDGRLTVDDAAALLTWAYMESGFRLNTRSGANTPDALVGHSWSMFQISLDTAEPAGIDIRELFAEPQNGIFPEAELERATKANARAALRLCFMRHGFTGHLGFLEWIRERYGSDPARVARALFIRAAGGAARGWDFEFTRELRPLVEVPPNDTPGSGGYIHHQLSRRLAIWPRFRAALGLQVVPPPADLKVQPRLPEGEA